MLTAVAMPTTKTLLLLIFENIPLTDRGPQVSAM